MQPSHSMTSVPGMTPKERARPAVGRTGARFGGPAASTPEDDPAVPAGEGGVEPEGAGDPAGPGSVGLTGARFGRAPRSRSRRRSGSPAAPGLGPVATVGVEAVAEAGQVPGAPLAGQAPIDPPGTRPQDDGAGPSSPGPSSPGPSSPGPSSPGPSSPGPSSPGPSSVRPYVLTRGRTRARVVLALETLVSVASAPGPGVPPDRAVRPEHEPVMALCARPRSVAEVAALLDVPLGVARVLVGDLAAAGSLTVHRTAGPAGADMALLERVLGGLHRL